MKRRHSLDAFVLGGLLLLLTLVSLRIASQGEPARATEQPRRSINSPRPGGWKGLALLLQRQGMTVERIERAPREWPADLPVIVTGEASTGADWTDAEAEAALRWVGAGRTLVILSGKGNALTERLGVTPERAGVADAILFPLQPAPFLAGVDGLHVPGRDRFSKVASNAVSLFADRKPAALLLRHKAGTVVAVSDPGIADNTHLTRADNARFVTSLLRAYSGSGGARVGFDEYHQGYRTADSFWDVVGRPGQLAAWQILGLTLLLAYSASRRFGLPRPLPAPPRVSSEYVASLADLYRRAHAGDAALESVYLSFWRDLCRGAALPYDAPTDEVIARATRRLAASHDPDLEERLRRVVNDCEMKIETGSVRDSELVPLVCEMEALRKELGLGGYDREPAAARG